MCEFSATVAFDKAANGQTDIKHSQVFCNTCHRGVGVVQLVERRTREPKDPRFEPNQEHKKMFFPVKNVVLTRYRCCPTPVCIRTDKNDHVRSLSIMYSMSEFGGLRKHEEKNQYVLVALGSAALAAAVALPRQGGPNFAKGLIKCILKKNIYIYFFFVFLCVIK